MKLCFNSTNLSQFGFNNVVLFIYLVGISQYSYFSIMLPFATLMASKSNPSLTAS